MDPSSHYNALDPAARLHWYEIKSILGQGGFGITYLALDTNLKQQVAIKEYLPSEYSTRDESSTVQPLSEEHSKVYKWGLERFLEEAQTLAQFKHPNIVRVQSFFEHNNTAYMIMEYEQGRDLAALIKAGEKFSEQRLLEILMPVLDGLEQVHAQGFIHRDIKPANIFIRADGTPVLIDFGSARHAIGGQTRTMTSLVTPGFAPFEQYGEADGKQGPWTDIYALGASLHCAITGKPPIDAIKRGIAKFEHQTDAYVGLAGLMTGKYSDHFLQAIDCALQFGEKDRPQTIAAWRAMLRGESEIPTVVVDTDLSDALKTSIETLVEQRLQAMTEAQAPAASPPPVETAPPQEPVNTAPTEPAAPAARSTGLIAGLLGAILVALVAVVFLLLRQNETAPTVVKVETPAAIEPVTPVVEVRYVNAHGDWVTRWQGASGKWTEGIRMNIADNSSASYSPGSGRIYFYEVDELGRWEGHWVEAPSSSCSSEKHGSRNWGVATFQFNDNFTEFNGTWDVCGQGKRFAWAGRRP